MDDAPTAADGSPADDEPKAGHRPTAGDDPIRDFVDTMPIDHADVVDHLRTAEIEILGRMPWSSNGTFLCAVVDGDRRCRAIYKPEAGERPLWDFPPGLWRREIAAWELSTQLGWDLVPPTVQRDGGLGTGSLQYFVPALFSEHYFTFCEADDLRPQLQRLCVFDLVANNTDRKGGHVLLTESRHVWAIDNGLSFHEEFKLRTVVWDFAGEPIPTGVVGDVAAFVESGPSEGLARLLSPAEVDAMLQRANAVIANGRFPHDPTGHRVPWPLV